MHLYNDTIISTEEDCHEKHGKNQIHKFGLPREVWKRERGEEVVEGRLCE